MIIGMNGSSIGYASQEDAPLNKMKTAGTSSGSLWAMSPKTGSVQPFTDLDALGYPKSFPAIAKNIFTYCQLGAGQGVPFVATFEGKATFVLQGATNVKQVTPNRIEFASAGGNGILTLLMTAMVEKPTNIRVFRADQEMLLNSGEIFNPAFIAKFGMFAWRFMDWLRTNDNRPVTWATRITLDHMSWAMGVPIEACVALCNKIGRDGWFELPGQCDDAYAREFLGAIKRGLRPDLKAEIEYSNEVWNWIFAVSRLAHANGDKLWGTDANHDGKIDPNDPKEHVGDGWLQWYGYRSAQLAKIAKEVFAGDDRLRFVLGVQTYAGPAAVNSVLTGVAKAQAGDPQTLFDELAITTYFGGQLGGPKPEDRAKVLGWAKGGPAGLDAAFHELEFGGGLSFPGSLADLPPIYARHKATADKYGWDLVAYEGGFGANATNYATDEKTVILDLYKRMLADARMGTLYTRRIADAGAAGIVKMMDFADVGPLTEQGGWGKIKSLPETSPRYEALVAAAVEVKPPIVKPTPTALLAMIDALRAEVEKWAA